MPGADFITDPMARRARAAAEAHYTEALTAPKRLDAARVALRALDFTSLSGSETAEEIAALCDSASESVDRTTVAAICVYPQHIAQAKAALRGSGVRVATVVNFPHGDQAPEAVAKETAQAIAAGADEIDAVLPYRAFLDGDLAACRAVLATVRAAVGEGTLKVIVESPVLESEGGLEAVYAAGRFAAEQGADFLKTSTGKSTFPGGEKRPETTPHQAAALMLAAAESPQRPAVKISGGVKSTNDAALLLALQEAICGQGSVSPDRFRIGASGVRDDLIRALEPDPHGQRGSARGDTAVTYDAGDVY